MLFIGTETYPEVDSFQNFVSSNGGSTNAYTANDHTNYFFDISSVEIKEGLSRFAHFSLTLFLLKAMSIGKKMLSIPNTKCSTRTTVGEDIW